jgi:hypothetical protein
MMLRCPVKYQRAESGVGSIGTCGRAVRLKFPSRFIIAREERSRHSLNATPVAELAHQVCDRRSSENIVCRPHFVKPAEHSGYLMQILPKTLKQYHLIEEV